MAQIFKSKELTFAVPEKESDDQRINCVAGTLHASLACTINCTCTHNYYSILQCTPHSCTNTGPVCTFTHTTVVFTPTTNEPYREKEVAEITDVATLEMLKEKLNNALKDVEGKLKEAKGK
jgi:hypothetical protein